jgi:hypothetical protein
MISIQLAYICIIFALFLSDTTLLEFRTHEIQRSKDPKLFGLVVHVYFLLHCISICSIITDICLGSLGQQKTSQNIDSHWTSQRTVTPLWPGRHLCPKASMIWHFSTNRIKQTTIRRHKMTQTYTNICTTA